MDLFVEPLLVPLAAQIACVERELGMRRSVYPRRVADGKMRQAQADQEVRAMEAVLETLQGLAAERAGELHPEVKAARHAEFDRVVGTHPPCEECGYCTDHEVGCINAKVTP